ncbi:MAG: GAF domain-containing protein [Candidatus Heimdallarchaeota archaeon]|nr:GAF domain-containing protein [Candidatus Heimdallarchaeota archaeon]
MKNASIPSENYIEKILEGKSEVRALFNAARAVLRNERFEVAARIIFDEARSIIGATSGYIALLSDDGSENEVLFLEAGGLRCTVDPDLPMPIRGLRKEAYDKNWPVWDNDFMNSPHVDFMPEGHVILKNVMFSPLIIDNKAVGVMGLANKKTDFTEYDVILAATFGEYAAMALTNSRNIDKLEENIKDLEQAIADIKVLQGLLPICVQCKKIKDDHGQWSSIEDYIPKQTNAEFSKGLCPDCKS